MQARMQHDILNCLRLANEFKLRFILEEATEAYQCLPQLKAANVPVIFGPIFMEESGYRAFSGEASDPRLNTPAQLAEAGITFALCAQEKRDEEGLIRQAMFARRYGLSDRQALDAVTSIPARLLGLESQMGVLAVGGAADLVVWSGHPLDATAAPKMVVINGRVVYER
jgi:imidazolonepropionase-like amidohydrolase